jgi:hypothetical protein
MKEIKTISPLRGIFVLLFAAGVLALSGCIFSTPPDEGDDGAAGFFSPAGVVELIEDAYSDRDDELYKKCLSPNFTFYFDSNDVGQDVGGYIIPTSWGYDDEVEAVENMFDQAHSIDIDLTSSNIGEPESDETVYNAPSVHIRLLVMVDAGNGFLADGFVEFEFESYQNEKGQKVWRVKDWKDYTAPA